MSDETKKSETYPKGHTEVVKVRITTNDGAEVWCYIHCFTSQRVQDVINDARPFLPISVLKENRNRGLPDEYTTKILNKNFIRSIDEITRE